MIIGDAWDRHRCQSGGKATRLTADQYNPVRFRALALFFSPDLSNGFNAELFKDIRKFFSRSLTGNGKSDPGCPSKNIPGPEKTGIWKISPITERINIHNCY